MSEEGEIKREVEGCRKDWRSLGSRIISRDRLVAAIITEYGDWFAKSFNGVDWF